jgi:hypothetical protein
MISLKNPISGPVTELLCSTAAAYDSASSRMPAPVRIFFSFLD